MFAIYRTDSGHPVYYSQTVRNWRRHRSKRVRPKIAGPQRPPKTAVGRCSTEKNKRKNKSAPDATHKSKRRARDHRRNRSRGKNKSR